MLVEAISTVVTSSAIVISAPASSGTTANASASTLISVLPTTSVSVSDESPNRKRLVSSPSVSVITTVPEALSTVTTLFQSALPKPDPEPPSSPPMNRPTRTATAAMTASAPRKVSAMPITLRWGGEQG